MAIDFHTRFTRGELLRYSGVLAVWVARLHLIFHSAVMVCSVNVTSFIRGGILPNHDGDEGTTLVKSSTIKL